jgi:single-strand DNA-binding protein
MSGSVNLAIIVGNCVKDAEIRSTSAGKEVANLVIATSQNWKDANGEKKEKVEFHRVTIFNPALVKVAKDYVRKGMKIAIQGMIETRKWQDQNGVDRYSTEIVLQNFNGTLTLLEAPKKEPTQHDKEKQNGYVLEMDDETVPF